MIRKISIPHLITWMSVFLTSMLCTHSVKANKNPLERRIDEILVAKDLEEGQKLYNEIKDTDMLQFPDSSLFNYHYLGGCVSDDKENYEKVLYHCLEAKRVSETSLGILNYEYVEIMAGIGRSYLEQGNYEQSLAYFQEGLVKAMHIRNNASIPYCNLLLGIQNCYECMGWLNEIPVLLMNAWALWDKEDVSLGSYTYYPLWNLHQFYRRYEMYEDAIKTSDLIIEFIVEKGGPNNPELAEELYFRGNTLNDMGKTDEAIEAYKNGISILESNKLEFDSDRSYYSILGNLLLALISVQRWDESDLILNKIKNYCDYSRDDELYNTVLNAVAFTLYQDGQYTKALYFVDLLLGRNLPAKRKETAENIREEILYSQEVINSIPDFERILQNSQSINKNWFETAFKLITAYFRKKETDKYHSLLTKAYHNLLYNEEAKKEYHFTILGALFNLNLNQGVYDLALKYALERWEYASLILDLPDRFKFECINNIVVAKLKSNKLDGIYEDLEKAEMLCRNVFGEDSETFAVVLHNRGRAFQLDGKFEDAKRLYQAAINLHSKTTGSPGPNTAKYLMETEKRLVDYELDL